MLCVNRQRIFYQQQEWHLTTLCSELEFVSNLIIGSNKISLETYFYLFCRIPKCLVYFCCKLTWHFGLINSDWPNENNYNNCGLMIYVWKHRRFSLEQNWIFYSAYWPFSITEIITSNVLTEITNHQKQFNCNNRLECSSFIVIFMKTELLLRQNNCFIYK